MQTTKRSLAELISGISDHYAMPIPVLEYIQDITDLSRMPKIVELGVCHGLCSVVLVDLAERFLGEYYGIDCFILDATEEEWRDTIKKKFGVGTQQRAHLWVGGTSSRVEVRGKWLEEVPVIKDIDLLVIDASHTEPWFSEDCRKWLPQVKPGGLVIFDDWGVREDGPIPWHEAYLAQGEGPNHNPHWAIPFFGTLYTIGWELVATVDRDVVMRKPL